MKILAKGSIVCEGVFTGNIVVISEPSQVTKIRKGDIMVVPKSHPLLAIGVMKADGLICEEGSVTSHICTIAMEVGIPCITQVENAMKLLAGVKTATLNADEGNVYQND